MLVKEDTPRSDDTANSWQRFENLARRLFAVPKHELDEEMAKDKPERDKKKPKINQPKENPEA